jgi:hypothetical protein
VLDTYFDLGDQGSHLPVPLDVLLLCFLGIDGLWEHLMLIIFRKERSQIAGIEGAVGAEPLFDDLQLGSAGVEVGHPERAGFVSVDGGERGRESGGFPVAALYMTI